MEKSLQWIMFRMIKNIYNIIKIQENFRPNNILTDNDAGRMLVPPPPIVNAFLLVPIFNIFHDYWIFLIKNTEFLRKMTPFSSKKKNFHGKKIHDFLIATFFFVHLKSIHQIDSSSSFLRLLLLRHFPVRFRNLYKIPLQVPKKKYIFFH